jgi:hypothetical protein
MTEAELKKRLDAAEKVLVFVVLLAGAFGTLVAQSALESNPPRPGVKEVQVPFASLKPSATIKIGGTADWVLITDDAIWVASTNPYAVHRIDPATNRIVAAVRVPGEACSGLASGRVRQHLGSGLREEACSCSHRRRQEHDYLHPTDSASRPRGRDRNK